MNETLIIVGVVAVVGALVATKIVIFRVIANAEKARGGSAPKGPSDA